MASAKNSDRRKRKYGERRKSITATNKAKIPARHESHIAHLAART